MLNHFSSNNHSIVTISTWSLTAVDRQNVGVYRVIEETTVVVAEQVGLEMTVILVVMELLEDLVHLDLLYASFEHFSHILATKPHSWLIISERYTAMRFFSV